MSDGFNGAKSQKQVKFDGIADESQVSYLMESSDGDYNKIIDNVILCGSGKITEKQLMKRYDDLKGDHSECKMCIHRLMGGIFDIIDLDGLESLDSVPEIQKFIESDPETRDPHDINIKKGSADLVKLIKLGHLSNDDLFHHVEYLFEYYDGDDSSDEENLEIASKVNVKSQLDNPETLAKYSEAGGIASKVVNKIIKLAKPGKLIIDLVKIGNDEIETHMKSINCAIKGVVFPISLSVNEVAGHCGAKNADILRHGDILKIEVGLHVDGYPAHIVTSTLIAPNGPENKLTDRQFNVMRAGCEAVIAVSKEMKPGRVSKEIVSIMEQAAFKYGCSLPITDLFGIIPGTLSFQMSRWVSGDDSIRFNNNHKYFASRYNSEHSKYQVPDEIIFEENEVYQIDIMICSGSGYLIKSADSVMFKRHYGINEQLKFKVSKTFMRNFKNKQSFNAPIIVSEEESKMKAAINECISKRLISDYPIVSENIGEYIARFKFTIVIKDKPIVICGVEQAHNEFSKLKNL